MNILRPHHDTVEIPESEIQKEAHRLWLEKGCPEGRDLETWLEAKELLKHRLPAETSGAGGHAGAREIRFSSESAMKHVASRQRKRAKA